MGELLGLKWTDVDLDRGVLKIQTGHLAAERQSSRSPAENEKRLPHPAAVGRCDKRSENAKMQESGNSEWVFPSPTGGPMSPDSVLHMLQRVLKRAGLPRIRFHDLRHTFATMALQNGVDVKTVSSVCWVTTRRASRWTPTPTSPPTPSSRRRKPWGISYPVRYRPFRYPLPLGSAFGSGKSGIQKQQLMKSKSPRNQTISRTFGTP